MIFNNKWSLRRHGVQWSVCAKVILYSIFIDSFTVAVSSLTTMAHFWYGYSPALPSWEGQAKRGSKETFLLLFLVGVWIDIH